MNDAGGYLGDRRRYLARAGICALNLITPGLGLLRVGQGRAGTFFLIAPFFLLLLFSLGMGLLPITNFDRAVFALATAIILWLAWYLASIVLTWRRSLVPLPVRIWSRWYGLFAIAIATTGLLDLMALLMHQLYKPFYGSSESMAPTIEKGDRFIADMRWRGPYRRGDIVIFKGPDDMRISRIAAVPGDQIAMRAGVPVVNAKLASQLPYGRVTVTGYNGPESAMLLTEVLPGEDSVHRVINMGTFNIDEMTATTVPTDHLFVLGDNRDRSADSRVSPRDFGAGMVAMRSVVGRPLYINWSSDRTRIGTRLDK